jgi:hypothetical protein
MMLITREELLPLARCGVPGKTEVKRHWICPAPSRVIFGFSFSACYDQGQKDFFAGKLENKSG